MIRHVRKPAPIRKARQMLEGVTPVHSGIDSFDNDDYPTAPTRKGREWLNTAIEVGLLWLAVILVIACWR